MSALTHVNTHNLKIDGEYGRDKRANFVVFLSHRIFQEEIPDAKMSGVTIGDNGVIRATINIPSQLYVETSPDDWSLARDLYLTLEVRAKLRI